jgi:hypothetical protein
MATRPCSPKFIFQEFSKPCMLSRKGRSGQMSAEGRIAERSRSIEYRAQIRVEWT